MSNGVRRRPSPALLVAVVALVAAAAGSAVADQATTAGKGFSKKQAKQVKKLAKKQAKKQIKKNFPVGESQIADGAITTGKVAGSTPAARVSRTSAQTIPHNSSTELSFTEERYDTAALHASGTPTRLTAPVAGVYSIGGSIIWGTDTDGGRTVRIQKNGDTFLAEHSSPASDNTVSQTISTMAKLDAGDYVEVQVVHTANAPLDIVDSGERSPEFAMTWLAPG